MYLTIILFDTTNVPLKHPTQPSHEYSILLRDWKFVTNQYDNIPLPPLEHFQHHSQHIYYTKTHGILTTTNIQNLPKNDSFLLENPITYGCFTYIGKIIIPFI